MAEPLPFGPFTISLPPVGESVPGYVPQPWSYAPPPSLMDQRDAIRSLFSLPLGEWTVRYRKFGSTPGLMFEREF